MGTGNMTGTTLDAFVKEVWSKRALANIYNKVLFRDLVDTSWENEIMDGGDTIHIPNISAVTTGSKADGTDVTFTNYTESNTDLVVDDYNYFAFVIEDKLRARGLVNIELPYIDGGSRQLAVDYDTAIALLIQDASITQNVGAQTSANAAYTDITDAVIRDAIEYLDEAGAPEDDRFCVISPKQKNAVLGIDKFVKASEIGDPSVIRKGLIGEIYGVMFHVSNNLPSTTGVSTVATGGDVIGRKDCMMFQRQAFATAVQQNIDVKVGRMPEKIGDAYTGTMLSGNKVVRPTFAVNIRTTIE